MIALIDYGVGNLRSVEKALRAVGADVELTTDPEAILMADKVVLPGVGAFGEAMQELSARGFVDPLRERIALGKPLLGICVGMQLLFEQSEELGRHEGLGVLRGNVRRFETKQLKVPLTGWNQIHPTRISPLLSGLPVGSYAYFNHSYYCDTAEGDRLAYSDYEIRYTSVVARDSVFGVQFHPEKSQEIGLTILRNFVERC